MDLTVYRLGKWPVSRVSARRSVEGFLVLVAAMASAPTIAQSVLFDFDDAPAHTPLPINLTRSGISAHFAGTGQSFSIQNAGVLGFTPAGFSGNSVYPSSVFAADLLITFNVPLSDFSIMYAPEEYACDSSATMRVTAYRASGFVASATTTAPNPGTWPTGILSVSAPAGFDNVVVHYDSGPPTGGDWGPIFMADNMTVTPVNLIFANGFE